MLKPLVTFILMLIGVSVFSQNDGTFKIRGVVVSAYSGAPITDAYIQYARNTSVLTDSLGRFTVPPLSAGRHTLSFSALGYEAKDTTITLADAEQEIVWVIRTTTCNRFSQQVALQDIRKGKPMLLLQGGIAPVVYRTDKHFMKKFKVSLFDFGCDASEKLDCILSYNQTVFEYLDKQHGKKWRKEVRPDIIGLKE